MIPQTGLTEAGVFAGIGGFQQAARLEGITTKWVCEINSYRLNILKQHFPNAQLHRNIFNLRNAPYVDILTGGFPCQDLSVSGPGTGIIGKRSRLWAEYLRVIYESRPRYVVIENSPQLANKGLEVVLYDLSQIGYNAEWQCVSAYDFGYPIIRERLFCIAFPVQVRYGITNGIFKGIHDVFQQTEIPKQIDLPMSLERINRHSDFGSLRLSPGFLKELDKNRIEAIGDSVNVTVAQYIFRCIKQFDLQLTNPNK